MRSLAILARRSWSSRQLALRSFVSSQALGLIPHVVGAIVVAGLVLIVAMFAVQQFPKHRDLRSGHAFVMLMVTFLQVIGGNLRLHEPHL